MAEKIKFWQQVMQMAHDRGIEVYVFTWNIFTNGAEGKHGITNSQQNDTTVAYFRAAVRELVKTYPAAFGHRDYGGRAHERQINRQFRPTKIGCGAPTAKASAMV